MPNITLGTSRARLNDLKSQRAAILESAEKELNAGNTAEYKSLLTKAQAMNAQIEDLNNLVTEYDRYDIAHAPTFGNDSRDMKAMGEHLLAGERVNFDTVDVVNALLTNSTTFSGSLVTPTGGSSQINDGTAAQVSTLIHQVRVETFDGLTSYEEGYIKSIQTASSGSLATVSGTARSASDPVWKKAKLMAHEVQTTSFVDRHLSRLSPAAYAAKCQGYALKSLMREVNKLICNGDQLGTHEIFGITNAKNTDNENIFAPVSGITSIDADTLRTLVFGYGGDEEVSSQARLILDKTSLDAFGKIKLATDDNRKLYRITQNGNTGTIEEGGLIVPFTISSAIGDKTIAYGDPLAYLLALFGPYSIRVDESVKSVERMIAILGDVLVGGNLTVDKGFSIATWGE